MDKKLKSQDTNNNKLKPQPTMEPQSEKIEQEYIDKGVSFNAVLNKNKRLMLKDQNDLSYTNSIVAEIKEKNAQKAKKKNIITLVIIGILIVATLLLFIFVPYFSKIITL